MQPSPPLRCEMAVRAAALAQARTAELLGVPAPASHQSTSCSGRCKKQTGPALFAPGNSRAASAIPPAAWLTHRVPARPPPASVLHLPSLPLGAGLVCAKRRRGFPSEHQRIFSKGQRFLRAHLPLAPSLFVFFFSFWGRGETLVLHFRSGLVHSYRNTRHVVSKNVHQPPLAFYIVSIETHLLRFPHARLLLLTNKSPGLENVCIQPILDKYPQARLLNQGSASEDFALMVFAKHIVLS